MNIDENDLLYTNNFIPKPELVGEVPPEFNEEFKNYYQRELQKQQEQQLKNDVEKISLLDTRYDEETDPTNLETSNGFGVGGVGGGGGGVGGVRPARIQREIKTYVNVDSRDRDLLKFPSANQFSIFLGRTFYNVSSIRLASFEFPNSNNVFNESNNRIHWRNIYDIENGILDPFTRTYPEYSIRLDTGNYTLSGLRNEIHNKGTTVPRDGTNDESVIFHNLLSDIDIATNEMTLTSLKYTKLSLNPFQLIGPYTIRLYFPEHPFKVGDTVHISGGLVSNGVGNTAINGKFKVTIVEDNHVTYNTAVQIPIAVDTVFGGLNVLCGSEEPFQLLFGEKTDTPVEILGFPAQNSADPIITTLDKDNLITNVFDNVNNRLSMIVTTKETHNFSSGNIGQNIVIYDAPYIPDLQKENKIVNVISDKQFEILGSYEFTYNDDTYNYDYRGSGFFYTRDPLRTIAPKIVNVVYSPFPQPGRITFTITTETPHYQKPGQFVKLLGLRTTPDISANLIEPGLVSTVSNEYTMNVFVFIGAEAPNTMEVDFSQGVVGTSLIELTCQNHGFNEVVSASTPSGEDYVLTTLFPHNIEFKQTSFDTIVPGIVENGTMNFTGESSFSLTKTGTGSDTFTLLETTRILTTSSGNTYQILDVKKPLSRLNFSYTTNITSETVPGEVIVSIYRPVSEDSGVLVNNISIPDSISPGTSSVTRSFTVENITGGISDGSYYFITTPKYINITLSVNAVDVSTTFSRIGTLARPPIIFYDTGNLQINGVPFGTKTNPLPQQPTPNDSTITLPINSGGFSLTTAKYKTKNNDFYLYNVKTEMLVKNPITQETINNKLLSAYKLLTPDKFIFRLEQFFSNSVEIFGGDIVYISGALHGFKGTQSNKLLTQVNRKIALDGENYVFLKCPQLATMLNTGKVDDIFARVVLDQYPGSMVFSFLSNPKVFNDAPLNQLDRLDFSIVEHDNKLYNFNDLDYSFVLEITEVQDTIENTNFSSRRGVNIINQNPYVSQGVGSTTGRSGDSTL